MPQWIDFYALSPARDKRTVGAFVADYARLDGGGRQSLLDSSVLPLGFEGHEDQLGFDDSEFIIFNDFEEVLLLGLSRPWRAFRVYLNPKPPWRGAVLCFTRTGEVIFGIAADAGDPGADPGQRYYGVLGELRERVAGVRAWAVCGEPPPLDPWVDQPWNLAETIVRLDNRPQRPAKGILH